MKVLIASSGVPGHLNPLLAVAKILVDNNDDVRVQTAAELRPMVEAAGITYIPEKSGAKSFVGHFLAGYPERQEKAPGFEMLGFDIEHYFAAKIPAQAQGLDEALASYPADLILADSFFWGTLPLLSRPRSMRPTVVHLGITVLDLGSGNNIPAQKGPSDSEIIQRTGDRQHFILEPAQRSVDRALASLGCGPLPCPVMESMSQLADLYLHPGIQGFEYPEQGSVSTRVEYTGSLPLPVGQAEVPMWWHNLDFTKRLVLVTQGTVANRDFGQLIEPTLAALANEEDLVVLVTTGGQPLDSIRMCLPANSRISLYLPFEAIMSKIALLITNGGYGTINMALAYGIPVLSAGMTEDKEEVSAHVQWSGAGIDLRTNRARTEDLHQAVIEILGDSKYASRAQELAREYATHNTQHEILSLLLECVYHSARKA